MPWSSATRGAALTTAPAMDSKMLFNVVEYTTVAIGYVLAVVDAKHLGLGPFLLFLGLNISWLVVCARVRDGSVWQLVGLISLAAAVLICLPLGLGYDWLLAAITTAVVAFVRSWRATLAVVLAFSVVSVIALRLAGDNWSGIVQVVVEVIPAFLFAAVFAIAMRRQQILRERAEELATTVAQANAELEAAHHELRERATQAEELAVARERNRMAREIHDTLGHYLTVLAVELETALNLEERGQPGLRDELAQARKVAGECLQAVRSSVAALRPAELALTSLEEALRRLVDLSEALLPETSFTLDIEGDTSTLSPEIHAALYRCAQEALTNVRKHAGASNVLVRLRVDDGADDNDNDHPMGEAHSREVELTVLDNGRGAQTSAPDTLLKEDGFGLVSMQERIEAVGGTLSAGAEPGRGWRVEAHIPLTPEVPLTRPSEETSASALLSLVNSLSGDVL